MTTLYTCDNPSPQYRRLLAWATQYHATRKTFTGKRTLHSFTPLRRLCVEHQAKTLLDYGAGKGQHYAVETINVPGLGVFPSLAAAWGVNTITPYDPAVPAWDVLPDGPFDGVFAIDTLDYIPSTDLPWVLAGMFARATKFVFHHGFEMVSSKLPAEEAWPPRLIPWWVDLFVQAGRDFPNVDWIIEIRPENKDPGIVWRRDGDDARLDGELTVPFDGSGVPPRSSDYLGKRVK